MKNLTIFLLLFLLKTTAFSQDFDKLIEEGDVYYNEKKYEEAARVFTKAIEADPSKSKGYWYRGDAYYHGQKYAEAIADYTKAIELEPEYNRFYTKRGNSFKGLNEIEKACADYQKGFELGDAEAKTGAREIECDWAKISEVPCQQGEAIINNVEIDPFTGAVFVSKGLSYSKFEFKPEESVGFITGPRIGKDESFVLKLLEPRGFCADGEDNVFVGIGFTLYDSAGGELGAVKDLYENKVEGLPAEYLKSLSATLGFTQLETGKNYRLKVRFFDKRGNGEIFVEMPFTSALKTDIFNNISSTANTLGIGINTSAVGAEIKALTFKNIATKAKADSFTLEAGQSYLINLQGIKKIGKNAGYILRVVSEEGDIVRTETGKISLKNGAADVNFAFENLKAGNYITWLRLYDTTKNNIGFSMITVIK